MLLTMDLLVVFYLFVVHVPPGHFLEKQLRLTLLFVTTTIGVLGANTLQEKKGRPRLALFGKRLKVALIAPAVLFSLWSLRGVGLRAVFEEAGLAFFFFAGFMSMTALSIYRVQRRVGTESHSATVGVALIACSFGAVSYFLGVLAFSVGLYPFIPVARGGGDYSETGFVTLRFRRAPTAPSPREGVPPEVLCDGENVNQSRPLRLIEMTQTDVYVAREKNPGDATKWRRGPRPQVFEIRREAVTSIMYSKEEVQCPAEPKKPPTEQPSPPSSAKRGGERPRTP